MNEDNFDEVRKATYEAHERGLTAVAIIMEAEAVRRVPVDTGNLKATIGHSTDDDAAYCFANAEYAPYQEYGTSRMPAQPYLRPALYDNKKKLKAVYESEISKAFK